VAELLAVSAQTRSGRLDRAYLHRRRLRGGKGSRAWYVDEAAWLAGTSADATAAPKFFQEEVCCFVKPFVPCRYTSPDLSGGPWMSPLGTSADATAAPTPSEPVRVFSSLCS